MPVPDIFQKPNRREEVSMSTLQIPSTEKRSLSRAMNSLAVVVTIAFAVMATLAPAVAQEKMTTPAPAATQETKPNILFIMGDDMGWMQPSIYHEGLAVGETPHIDRIGHEGAKFLTYYDEQR